MGYAIHKDMTEVCGNPDRWANHGRHAIENACNHHDEETGEEETKARYYNYCDDCGLSENTAYPMMDYLYPLELTDFEESKILKVVKETNCTVLEDTEEGGWFLALCGGGMDLSQDIALRYIILEKWIPIDLLNNVCKQACLSLGSKKWVFLAREAIKQLRHNELNFKQKRKDWKESYKRFKKLDKAKRDKL